MLVSYEFAAQLVLLLVSMLVALFLILFAYVVY